MSLHFLNLNLWLFSAYVFILQACMIKQKRNYGLFKVGRALRGHSNQGSTTKLQTPTVACLFIYGLILGFHINYSLIHKYEKYTLHLIYKAFLCILQR